MKILDRFKCWIFKKLIPKDPSLKIELLKDLFPQTNSIFLGIDDIDMGGKRIVNLGSKCISLRHLVYFLGYDWVSAVSEYNKPSFIITFKGLGIKADDVTGTEPAVTCVTTENVGVDVHIRSYILPNEKGGLSLRVQGQLGDIDNYLGGYISLPTSTCDHSIWKRVSGTWTRLAYEAVDLDNVWHDCVFSISGSTLKSSRDGGKTFPISATDTDITSDGRAGLRHSGTPDHPYFIPISIGAPLSIMSKTLIIIEMSVIGSGSEEDPIQPDMYKELVEVTKDQIDLETWYIIQSNPRGKNNLPLIDKASVTWGAFDFAHEKSLSVRQGYRNQSPTFIVLIKGGNMYVGDEAIKKQIEYAKSRNMYVKITTDISRDKAIEIYKELKARGHDFIAGVDDLWYQLNGSADIEPLAVADFYYGNVINLRRLDLSKVVDADRTLKMWLDRLNKSRVSESIKEKHRRKLIEVMKKG